MAVPQSRTSVSRRNMRRAHDFLQAKCLSECANCGAAKRPHHVCPHCGHYRGRLVVSRAVDE